MQEERVCIECGKEFVFEDGEKVFFERMGFTEPKRCPVCRRNRKNNAKTVEAELNKRDKNKGGN